MSEAGRAGAKAGHSSLHFPFLTFMLPVSLRFPSATVLALLASLGLSSAGDIVKLKTGEKLDGVILSESPTEVVIEIALGKGGIKDQKKVPRKDIAEVIKATPDQI
ncbi:MAG: hypothetical protein JWL81_2189, partial [Verrucomicrobiales bacterium]|nr:hypothetical protein [Verrucomicrobiales bacterium]